MIKFVAILTLAILANFIISFTQFKSNENTDDELVFSNEIVTVESGQPVYSKGTEIAINNSEKKQMEIYLNEQVIKTSEQQINLSQVAQLNEGTYTLVINKGFQEKTYGFTIQ